MFFPEPELKPAKEREDRVARVELYICRCPDCQCHCRTPFPSKVCYSCRGGAGVAHSPQEPAHRPQARSTYPKDAPVHA